MDTGVFVETDTTTRDPSISSIRVVRLSLVLPVTEPFLQTERRYHHGWRQRGQHPPGHARQEHERVLPPRRQGPTAEPRRLAQLIVAELLVGRIVGGYPDEDGEDRHAQHECENASRGRWNLDGLLARLIWLEDGLPVAIGILVSELESEAAAQDAGMVVQCECRPGW